MTEKKTARNPELTRERILDAAAVLFVEHGVSAVAMSDIARASGVTKSLIHHHFGSKDQLWNAVKERSFEHYFGAQMAMLEAEDEPGPELLKASVEEFFRFLKDHPAVARLFAWAHLERDNENTRAEQSLIGLGAARVRQAQENGLLRSDVNPSHVVATFVMICMQWFQGRAHHSQWPGMGTEEALLEDFLKVFMDGLRPKE